MDETDHDAVARLRATAHPVRLRMLSLLTAEAMSAAEVARALELTHANASYHLRQLHDVGALVVESEEKIRGGVAKRYRSTPRKTSHPASPAPTSASPTPAPWRPRRSDASSTRRRAPPPLSDLEAWVTSRAGTGRSTSARGLAPAARRRPTGGHPGHRPRERHAQPSRCRAG